MHAHHILTSLHKPIYSKKLYVHSSDMHSSVYHTCIQMLYDLTLKSTYTCIQVYISCSCKHQQEKHDDDICR